MTQEQWLAIKNRDKSWDGCFYYGMKTTKTVCKPSCRKRTGNPKNIVIFSSVREALEQGYHPCKLCRPELTDWSGSKNELVAAAKKQIEELNSEGRQKYEVIQEELSHIMEMFSQVQKQFMNAYRGIHDIVSDVPDNTDDEPIIQDEEVSEE